MYEDDFQPIRDDDYLFSTPMNRFIGVGSDYGPYILISVTREFYSWLTPCGLFLARLDDAVLYTEQWTEKKVLPRAIEKFQ